MKLMTKFTTAIICFILITYVVMADKCPTSPNSAGPGAVILQDNNLLTITGMPADQFCIAIWNNYEMNPIPFGNGFLCIPPGGGGRLEISKANSFGELFYDNTLATGSAVQLWYRDGQEFNLSNSIITQ